jgi:hypothetical protein
LSIIACSTRKPNVGNEPSFGHHVAIADVEPLATASVFRPFSLCESP